MQRLGRARPQCGMDLHGGPSRYEALVSLSGAVMSLVVLQSAVRAARRGRMAALAVFCACLSATSQAQQPLAFDQALRLA